MTHLLELRIPPPLVGLTLALAMWGAAPHLPWRLDLPSGWAWGLAMPLAALGGVFALGGTWGFRRAKTTVNPLKPERTSALVTGGVYRFSRNPMYLGMALVLLAWAVLLRAPLALVGPLVFAAYITRFQIVPEERVLTNLFGAEYAAYQAQVRRWC